MNTALRMKKPSATHPPTLHSAATRAKRWPLKAAAADEAIRAGRDETRLLIGLWNEAPCRTKHHTRSENKGGARNRQK